jgi:muramoyltetrapeptide carboxypeptidase
MRVRIEAPSSPFSDERLKAGVERLVQLGHEVDATHAGPRGSHAYLNGDDAERARSLSEALASDADIVWLVRGGYGLTRIVDDLSLPAPGTRTPALVGFSDATALLCHLHARGFSRLIHGPLVTTLPGEPADSVSHLGDILAGRARSIGNLRSLNGAVDVEGALVAANLCVLAHLVGTRSMPSLDGAVLVLEEIGERPYRIDRMLTQLLSSGALAGVRAVVCGDFLQCDEPPQSGVRDAAPGPLDVVRERLGARMPVVVGAPVGHRAPNFAIPFGVHARVVGDGASARLDIAGSGVA